MLGARVLLQGLRGGKWVGESRHECGAAISSTGSPLAAPESALGLVSSTSLYFGHNIPIPAPLGPVSDLSLKPPHY